MDPELGVWRRSGETVYAVLVGVAFVAQVVALGSLTVLSSLKLMDLAPGFKVETFLIGSIALIAVALFGLVLYVLISHSLNDRRAAKHAADVAASSQRWVGCLFGVEEFPKAPLRKAEAEALVRLAETLHGPEGAKVRSLIMSYGVGALLMKHAYKGRLHRRMRALELLAQARIPDAMPNLLSLMSDERIEIRRVAVRAAARTLAGMQPGPARTLESIRFAESLAQGLLPSGSAEEALLLGEEASAAGIRYLLARPTLEGRFRRVALNSVGRLMLRELGPVLVQCATDPDPEVRAASFRAISRLGTNPRGFKEAILAGVADEVDFVRVHATRSLWLLEPRPANGWLNRGLGDRSWAVRRAAAETFIQMGVEGTEMLRRAVHNHPDKYGRDMARQILRDANPPSGSREATGSRV